MKDDQHREYDFSYRLIRSRRRRTIAIEITEDIDVIVRAPVWVPMSEIERFVAERREWILKNTAKMRKRIEERRKQESEYPVERLSMEQIRELADKAVRIIPQRVSYYAKELGVTYGRITIRNQRSRWGSCSSKGNLNFNCLLMLTPPEVIDSVIVHELCHRKYMNHSQSFYNEIYRVFPEYDAWDRWLKENENRLMRRMTG